MLKYFENLSFKLTLNELCLIDNEYMSIVKLMRNFLRNPKKLVLKIKILNFNNMVIFCTCLLFSQNEANFSRVDLEKFHVKFDS